MPFIKLTVLPNIQIYISHEFGARDPITKCSLRSTPYSRSSYKALDWTQIFIMLCCHLLNVQWERSLDLLAKKKKKKRKYKPIIHKKILEEESAPMMIFKNKLRSFLNWGSVYNPINLVQIMLYSNYLNRLISKHLMIMAGPEKRVS